MSEWRAIPGWEGLYEVSDEGQVRSTTRIVRGKVLGRNLNPYINNHGYEKVNLCNLGAKSLESVHRLVMLAFVGECPNGHEVLHADGNPLNNRLSNLSYGTRSQNVRDSIKHGTNVNAAKTHCKRGHAFTEANTYLRGSHRHCRKCTDIRRAKHKARKAMVA